MHSEIGKAASLLYVVTALVSGYWGFRAMFLASPGPLPWVQSTIFGAPILLLIGGLLILSPQLEKKWLIVLAAAILVVFWGAYFRDVSNLYLVFAAAVMLITWAVLGLASTLRRPAIVAFIPSLILALCWTAVPIGVFRNAVSIVPPIGNAVKTFLANGPLMVVWMLTVAASVLSGVATFRRSAA